MRTKMLVLSLLIVLSVSITNAGNVLFLGTSVENARALGYKSPGVAGFVKSESGIGRFRWDNQLKLDPTPKIKYGSMLNTSIRSGLMFEISRHILAGGSVTFKNEHFLDLGLSYWTATPNIDVELLAGPYSGQRLNVTAILPGKDGRYRSYGYSFGWSYDFKTPVRIGFSGGSINLSTISVRPIRFGWSSWCSGFIAYRFGH